MIDLFCSENLLKIEREFHTTIVRFFGTDRVRVIAELVGERFKRLGFCINSIQNVGNGWILRRTRSFSERNVELLFKVFCIVHSFSWNRIKRIIYRLSIRIRNRSLSFCVGECHYIDHSLVVWFSVWLREVRGTVSVFFYIDGDIDRIKVFFEKCSSFHI